VAHFDGLNERFKAELPEVRRSYESQANDADLSSLDGDEYFSKAG